MVDVLERLSTITRMKQYFLVLFTLYKISLQTVDPMTAYYWW